MTNIIKKTVGLTRISRFYTSTAVLTLLLWIASFMYIQNIVSDTDRLYQHPFKVSKASLKIQFQIQTMLRIMNDIKYTKTSDQIKAALSLVNKHESELLSEFTLISQRYLGKKEVIDNIYQSILTWREIRLDIFNLYLQKATDVGLKYAEQQNNKHVKKLQHEILAITEFASNKAKVLTESAKSNFSNVEKFGFVFFLCLLSIQLLLFMMFKRHSIKDKNKVLKALDWCNQLFDSSPDAIIIADQNGEITQANITAEKMFGYDRAEFLGLNISELMPKRFTDHQEKIKSFFDHSSSRVMGEGRDLFAVKKSGQEFQVEISLNLAKLNDKKMAITSIRDITKQKQIELKVLHQANYDSLTQLPNRSLSLERLSTSIAHAKRNGSKFAIMFIDLDDFKKANDLFGHQTGDRILVSTAARLNNIVRPEDTVGRFGGDEFFILIDSFSSQESLIEISNNILEALKKPFSIRQLNTLLSASIGISIYPDDGDTVEDLLVSADLSMYSSKNTGKNSFTFFESSMRDTLNRQSSIEEALKGSLDRHEFHVVYQPKYEISSNTIIGFEAL